MVVRYVRDEEVIAQAINTTRRGLRDVQRPTGTEVAGLSSAAIVGSVHEYAVSGSPSVPPTGGWVLVPPVWVDGVFVWRRTRSVRGDGVLEVSVPELTTGPAGAPGVPGVSVVSVQPLFKAGRDLAPRIEGAGTWAEVRRNYIRNPRFAHDTGGWAAVRCTLSRSSSSKYPAEFRGIVVATEVGGAPSVALQSGTDISLPAGNYVFRFERDMGGTSAIYSGVFSQPGSVALSAKTTHDALVEHSFTLAEAGVVQIRIGTPAGAAVGTQVAFTRVSLSGPGGYFDGSAMDASMPQPEDFRVRWLGTPNASESVMEGERVRGLTVTGCIAVVSSRNGKPAARLVSTTAGTISYAEYRNPAVASGGTWAATAHLDAPLTGSLDRRRAGLDVYSPQIDGPRAANEAGSYPLRQVFGALTGNYAVRLWHGGALGSGDVWWSDTHLYAGDFFDYTTWATTEPLFETGLDLWRAERITYSSGTIQYTEPTRVTSWDGVSDATDNTVVGQAVEYAVNTSATAPPTTGWTLTTPSRPAGSYVWMRVVVTYGDGATSTSMPANITGDAGDDGTNGADGVSVTGLTFYYYISTTQPATPTVSPPPAPWTTTEPTPTPGETRNLYVTVRTTLSNGSWAYTPVTKSAAFEAARDAYNKYTFSTAAPTTADGTGKPVGALWVRKDSAGEIVGYWEWDGSAWQVRPLSQEVIPLIVANMLSADAIDGMTITGALVRTAATGQRMEFDVNGLRAFNAAGAAIATLAAASGGMRFGLSDGAEVSINATSGRSEVGASRLLGGTGSTSTVNAVLVGTAHRSGVESESKLVGGGKSGFQLFSEIDSDSGLKRTVLSSTDFLEIYGPSMVLASGQPLLADEYLNQAGGISAPHATAAGSDVARTVATNSVVSTVITLPASRFTQPPNVQVSLADALLGAGVAAGSVTTSQFTIHRMNTSTVSRTFGVRWLALQMTATSADG